MSEHAQLVAVAGAAAAALVAEMVKDSWASVRSLAERIFRHSDDEGEVQRQLNRLDADQAQASALNQAELRSRWERRLLTLVEDFPAAENDLKVLAGRHAEDQHGAVNQNATGNTGPVIQVGRDNFGGLNTEGR